MYPPIYSEISFDIVSPSPNPFLFMFVVVCNFPNDWNNYFKSSSLIPTPESAHDVTKRLSPYHIFISMPPLKVNFIALLIKLNNTCLNLLASKYKC